MELVSHWLLLLTMKIASGIQERLDSIVAGSGRNTAADIVDAFSKNGTAKLGTSPNKVTMEVSTFVGTDLNFLPAIHIQLTLK